MSVTQANERFVPSDENIGSLSSPGVKVERLYSQFFVGGNNQTGGHRSISCINGTLPSEFTQTHSGNDLNRVTFRSCKSLFSTQLGQTSNLLKDNNIGYDNESTIQRTTGRWDWSCGNDKTIPVGMYITGNGIGMNANGLPWGIEPICYDPIKGDFYLGYGLLENEFYGTKNFLSSSINDKVIALCPLSEETSDLKGPERQQALFGIKGIVEMDPGDKKILRIGAFCKNYTPFVRLASKFNHPQRAEHQLDCLSGKIYERNDPRNDACLSYIKTTSSITDGSALNTQSNLRSDVNVHCAYNFVKDNSERIKKCILACKNKDLLGEFQFCNDFLETYKEDVKKVENDIFKESSNSATNQSIWIWLCAFVICMFSIFATMISI